MFVQENSLKALKQVSVIRIIFKSDSSSHFYLHSHENDDLLMIYYILDTSGPWTAADIDDGAADGTQQSHRERQTCSSLISSPLQRISRFPFIPYYLIIILLSGLNWESCGQGATHDASRSTEAINPMNTDFSSSCYSECVSIAFGETS